MYLWLPSIRNQQDTDMCASYAVASALEILYRERFDVNFLHHNGLKIAQRDANGITCRRVLFSCNQWGAIPEKRLIAHQNNYKSAKPSKNDYAVATRYRTIPPISVLSTKDRVGWLDKGRPWVCSVDVQDLNKYQNVGKNKHGHHSMVVVGYQDLQYIIQNSWGEEWGEGSLCRLPFTFPFRTSYAVGKLICA